MSAVADELGLSASDPDDRPGPIPQYYSSGLQAAIAKARRQANVMFRPNASSEAPAMPLFANARNAVIFAVTRDGAPARPPASKMTDTTSSGRELIGLDATTQAGYILGEIRRLGQLWEAVLIASCVPKEIPCQCKRLCCSGKTPSFDWARAIGVIAQEAQSLIVSQGERKSKASYALCFVIIERIFGRKESTLKDIADEFMLDQDTVGKHHRTIIRWLRGYRAGKDQPMTEGLESIAWADAESVLRDSGIVG